MVPSWPLVLPFDGFISNWQRESDPEAPPPIEIFQQWPPIFSTGAPPCLLATQLQSDATKSRKWKLWVSKEVLRCWNAGWPWLDEHKIRRTSSSIISCVRWSRQTKKLTTWELKINLTQIHLSWILFLQLFLFEILIHFNIKQRSFRFVSNVFTNLDHERRLTTRWRNTPHRNEITKLLKLIARLLSAVLHNR